MIHEDEVTDRLHKSLEAVCRLDQWDPDTRSDAIAATMAERDRLGGTTEFMTKPGVILQVNYIRKTFMNMTPSKEMFMANLQTA